ncbi:hypothetical protein C0993_001171 [Termitomyces sp. T159_Od127]|nr:hypothetical protein C0993_001171 [Termitomyces sp. T159_Od127]
MGEAVLRDIAKKRGIGIVVDSCGTSAYHIGEDPDDSFTHILAADESNLRQLLRIKPENSTADVRLWGSYLDNKPIPDPYYGGSDGFEKVFQQCMKLSNAFLDAVIGEEN